MEQIKSAFLRFSSNDAARGALVAVFAALWMSGAAIAAQPNFDVLTIDWGALAHTDLNLAVVTFFAYITKNFFSDEQGKFLGRV